jgi:hypothetical protein
MISPYVQAVCRALGTLFDFVARLALPLSVALGLAAVAAAAVLALRRDSSWLERLDWRRYAASVLGYTAVALVVVAGWAVLRTTQPLARQDIQWREAAEATAKPTADAPPVTQFGPVAAALVEHTYQRTLTLPPEFLQRVGSDGIGVLSPYLTDPSAENVLRLAATFRRSGRNVVFTRQATTLDEAPIPFTRADVRVRFRRPSTHAYDSEFEGRYAFRNAGDQPITARFLFNLPQDGTVRDLSVTVGDQPIPEPNEAGAYEWKREMAAGEQREAVVHYRLRGARSWHYDLGSRRRRVEQFHLDASPGGPVRFMKGSLQPSASAGGTLRWDLANVVTAQQVALAFLPDIVGRDTYLQALTALPASLILFLVGMVVLGLRLGRMPGPGTIAAALVLFAFGLGAAVVLANYLGAVAAVILAPLAGALLAARLLGRWSLLAALPAALLPAAFLSPEHSGLLVLLLAAVSLPVVLLTARGEAA